MKGNVKIRPVSFDIELEADDKEVEEFCRARVEAARERIEAAIGEAICAELRRLLPGIAAKFTLGDDDDEEAGA